MRADKRGQRDDETIYRRIFVSNYIFASSVAICDPSESNSITARLYKQSRYFSMRQGRDFSVFYFYVRYSQVIFLVFALSQAVVDQWPYFRSSGGADRLSATARK